ncbi:MAG: hypothetical protein M5R36_18230 [Deltaproteobacteria bacterium]|nr:hypothetical protein [Deltaproteobacteria bacterium]
MNRGRYSAILEFAAYRLGTALAALAVYPAALKALRLAEPAPTHDYVLDFIAREYTGRFFALSIVVFAAAAFFRDILPSRGEKRRSAGTTLPIFFPAMAASVAGVSD